jgi:23S rRNA (guanosine2251-2'-O)-methyltransferase
VSRQVFGIQPVREALRVHGAAVRGLLLQKDSDNPKVAGLARLAEQQGVPIGQATRSELDRRAKGGMHQGAIAEAPDLALLGLDDLVRKLVGWEHAPAETQAPLVTLLDGVMDPMNFGAVVRSAVALGPGWIVFPEHGAAPLTPATFRASAGAIEHATLFRVPSLVPALQVLHEAGGRSVLLEGSAERTLEDEDLTGLIGLIVGSEDKGARPAVRKAASVKARLPMSGRVQSLNASVAAALAHYEVGRQRRRSSNS